VETSLFCAGGKADGTLWFWGKCAELMAEPETEAETLSLRFDVGREWLPFPLVGPGFCACCLALAFGFSKA